MSSARHHTPIPFSGKQNALHLKLNNMKELLISILVITLNLLNVSGQDAFDLNCFTVIVGKNASIDGSVFIAHNEDNTGDPFVELHKVPRIKHKQGEKQTFVLLKDSIDEPTETFGYFWITGAKYNEEQYMNEWGVALTSNASRSKIVNEEGKIEHNLRRIVIERAHSAREAVRIAGALVEKYGYSFSGRVYSIADPNEAWIFEVAKGKHWIAKRVPDDEVVLVPNYYVIDAFNIADTLNCLSSPEIVTYAIDNGWYNPATDKSFNFRWAYCRKDKFDAIHNIARRWIALNKLSEKQYRFYDNFPFSFKPKHKLSIQELMDIMQNHYENTEFEMNPAYNNGCPHYNTTTTRICNNYTDYCCITQLRNWLPIDIGNVMWIASRYPCFQPFIPWYYGIVKILPDYEKATYIAALQDYNNKDKDYRTLYPDHACWTFGDFALEVDSCYGKEIKSLKKWKNNFEMDIFRTLKVKEDEIVNIYKSNPDKARQMLTDLSNDFAEKALIETKKRLTKIASR
jgi:dipeptidase